MTASTETQIALLIEHQKTMEGRLADVHADIKALQDERDRALRWGVMSLGTAVLGMAYWIFAQITGGHLK